MTMTTFDRHRSRETVEWILGWWWILPVLTTLLTLAGIAGQLSPPATGVAFKCFGAAAVLLVMKVLTWAIVSHEALGRHERAGVLVGLLLIAGGWVAARNWIFEKQFSYLVAASRANLKLSVGELSGRILVFLGDRARHAPPAPVPATWERDELAVLNYQNETARTFDESFEPAVRWAHELLKQNGLIDPDLDAVYLRPTSPFEMQVIAVRLTRLARRLPDP